MNKVHIIITIGKGETKFPRSHTTSPRSQNGEAMGLDKFFSREYTLHTLLVSLLQIVTHRVAVTVDLP